MPRLALIVGVFLSLMAAACADIPSEPRLVAERPGFPLLGAAVPAGSLSHDLGEISSPEDVKRLLRFFLS